jgi:hypothetical protein
LFSDFPWFRLAAFEAHVTAWIGRAPEADLIPGIGVCIVSINDILHEQQPEAMDGHLLPDIVGGWWLSIVNALEHRILLPGLKIDKCHVVQVAGDGFDSSQTETMGLMIGRHILKAITVNAPIVEPIIDIIQYRNFMSIVAIILW